MADKKQRLRKERPKDCVYPQVTKNTGRDQTQLTIVSKDTGGKRITLPVVARKTKVALSPSVISPNKTINARKTNGAVLEPLAADHTGKIRNSPVVNSEKKKGYIKPKPKLPETENEMSGTSKLRTRAADRNRGQSYEDAKVLAERLRVSSAASKSDTSENLNDEATSSRTDDRHADPIGTKTEQTMNAVENSVSYGAMSQASVLSDLNKQLNNTDPGIIIVIMNASGAGQTKPEDRRKAIAHTVNTTKPRIVLFQEFTWKGITGKIWDNCPLPSHYQYFGHPEASVLYDVRDIIAEEVSSTKLRRILETLQRTPNRVLHTPFPLDFDPLSRMCACLISTIGVPFWEFICVSWHGPWRGYSLDGRKTYFKCLLEFLRNIMIELKRPILIAGDFNIDFQDIVTYITHPFKTYEYTPAERRTGLLKDYFITSFDMDLNKTHFVEIGDYKSCLDHDPVVSCLSMVV